MSYFNGEIQLIYPEIAPEIAVDISPDNKAATVVFDEPLEVSLGQNKLVNNNVISLSLPIEINDTNVTFTVDIRGDHNLYKGARGLLVTLIGGKTETFIISGSDELNERGEFSHFINIEVQNIEPQDKKLYPATFFLLLERFSDNNDGFPDDNDGAPDDDGELYEYVKIDSLDFEFVQS